MGPEPRPLSKQCCTEGMILMSVGAASPQDSWLEPCSRQEVVKSTAMGVVVSHRHHLGLHRQPPADKARLVKQEPLPRSSEVVMVSRMANVTRRGGATLYMQGCTMIPIFELGTAQATQ